jgi:phage tail-like protein
MTQVKETEELTLRITPMQLPEAMVQPITEAQNAPSVSVEQAINPQATYSSGIGTKSLVLYPGEPNELLIQLMNQSKKTYCFDNLQVEGDFPRDWYTTRLEGQILGSKRTIEGVIRFEIPPDFFESHHGWNKDRSLQLDYWGKINLHFVQIENEGDPFPDTFPQLKSASFNVYVRPRSLYLNFVPDLYKEVDFIGRFLKIFETAFEPAVQQLDLLWSYLDPLTAPESLLNFLAHWVGWEMTPHIGIERQRYLISQAVTIYRWRGTKKGLRFYIHLYTGLPLDEDKEREEDKHIMIKDTFGQGLIMGKTRLGEDSLLGGGKPYYFVVRLRPQFPGQIDKNLIRKIIDTEKPAFCTYDLYIDD